VEAEREARTLAERAADRARRVQRLTAQLNEAVGRAQIADVILEGGLAAVGADAGSLALVHSDAEGRAERFEIIRTHGYGAEVAERYRNFRVVPGKPLSEAVLRRETVAIGTPEEWSRVFPGASEDLETLGFQAFVAVPASVGERTLAALSFSFREPQEFDDATRTFLSTLSEQCALALERARLHEVELHQAEWHAALLETIQDAFVALDAELRYTYVNPRAEALLRRSAAEILGRRMEEVFPDAPGSPVHDALLRTLVTGLGTQVEAFSPVTGQWVEARIYSAPAGVSLVFQDITDRRRAQDSTRRRCAPWRTPRCRGWATGARWTWWRTRPRTSGPRRCSAWPSCTATRRSWRSQPSSPNATRRTGRRRPASPTCCAPAPPSSSPT
jgi:PAS domain S-box-containing protein